MYESFHYLTLVSTHSIFKLLGLAKLTREEKCFLVIVTVCFLLSWKRFCTLREHLQKSRTTQPFLSRQRTEGKNNSETEVSTSWKITVIRSLKTSTCLFPFHLHWRTKLTINVCQVEFASLWCKRGSLFHICPSKLWCFPFKSLEVLSWKIQFKEFKFQFLLEYYLLKAPFNNNAIISPTLLLSFQNHCASVRKVSEPHGSEGMGRKRSVNVWTPKLEEKFLNSLHPLPKFSCCTSQY